VNLNEAVEDDIAANQCAAQISQVQFVYFNFNQTLALAIAANPSSMNGTFSNFAVGKITPLGLFANNGPTMLTATLYFYALLGSAQMVNYTFRYIECSGNTVSIRVDVLLHSSTGFPAPYYNLTQSGTFFFDDNGLIRNFDLNIPQLGQALNLPVIAQPSAINTLCGGIQALCVGSNQQYDNTSACVSFMQSIPFGGKI
jgi:hypothetical protein